MVRKIVLSALLAAAVAAGTAGVANAYVIGIGHPPVHKEVIAGTRTAPPQPPSVFS